MTETTKTPPRAGLKQDPHQTLAPVSNVLEAAIGREVRDLRKERDMTVADLAQASGLSPGMLSKIENGAISPSLTSLQALAQAFGVHITTLFRRHEEHREALFVPAGEGVDVERRGTRAGHQYRLLGHSAAAGARVVVEPYMITLTEESDVFPTFQHSGIEFLHMIEGEVTYRHGDRLYRMAPGDSLYFDANAPHGPEGLHVLPIRYLSVISYSEE
ncbi:helix-turn-helix transcriptional regulator [Rhodobacteraceae bacterium NNCM2]|nr:helix-turn-helix transcriptional regulator [Coraliihabitans acroporae]